jgi:hypothetical protein
MLVFFLESDYGRYKMHSPINMIMSNISYFIH